MKEGIHPNYRDVVFVDLSNGFQFVTRSTVQTKETIELDGKTLPLVKLETTSESHPFYTGAQKSVDTWAAASRSSATSSRTSRSKSPTRYPYRFRTRGSLGCPLAFLRHDPATSRSRARESPQPRHRC